MNISLFLFCFVLVIVFIALLSEFILYSCAQQLYKNIEVGRIYSSQEEDQPPTIIRILGKYNDQVVWFEVTLPNDIKYKSSMKIDEFYIMFGDMINEQIRMNRLLNNE